MSRYATALARMFASPVLAVALVVLGTAAGVAATSGEGRIVFARSQPGIPSDSVVTDDTLLSTAGIHAISADGPKVAIRYDGGKILEFFGRVEVWQPGEAPRRYPADLCVLCEVALSQGRVAWSEYEESNHSAGWVSTTRVWPVRVKDVAYANEDDGEHVGAMKADRTLILFEMHVRRSTSIHSIDAGGRVRVVRRYAAPVTLLDAEHGLLAIRVDAGRSRSHEPTVAR